MKKQNGFLGFEILLVIAVMVIVGLTGYYVWRIHYRAVSQPTPIQTIASGCNSPTKSVQVDGSIVAEAKAAIIAKGFSATWFEQHFRLVSTETHTNVLTDPSTG